MHFKVCCIFILMVGGSLLYSHPSTTRFQAIIFDCDGVLVDTEYLKFLAWQEAFEAIGISFSIEEYVPVIGYSSKAILQMIRDAKKIEFPESIVEVKNVNYKRLQKQGVPPIQEIIQVVLRLFECKQQLGIRLAVASSAPKEEILINLKQIGLENVFDLIISGSDDLKAYSDVEGTNKPKPYIYIEIAKRLGVSPEFCLVFEDTQAGIDAAANAGMVAVAVPNQFTLGHDFSKAYHVMSSYSEFSSFTILENLSKEQ